MRTAALLLLLAALTTAVTTALQEPPGAPTGTVAGEVLLLLSDKTTAPGADAVIWLPGAAGSSSTPARLELAQKEKRFVPHVLAVRSGDAVSFPNLDRIYHNVFSVTPGHEFDLGLYHRGTAKSQRFTGSGVVQVYCNIHAQMAANVVVVGDGPFSTSGTDGRFELRGVPAGAFPLHVWHERGGDDERPVVVRAGGTTSVQVVLDASRYKPVAHKNKHGNDYPPVALDDDRY
ncbi:MAG TPA: carboxypeptidase regulatory-like domain-containing protein [Thermoanaerobaculia bacterium]|nr:carboxypeptidase regulatory-like domain-containing protein [Thermoanaerobaculia bacterium]